MTKFVIELNREGCIGAGTCEAANPAFWKLDNDLKINLVDGKKNSDNSIQTREIDESELQKNLEAAQACPVQVIHIINKETGKRLI